MPRILKDCPRCGRTVNRTVNVRCPAADCDEHFLPQPDEREIRTDGGMSSSQSRLNWPAELERTPDDDRESTTKFDVTLGKAISEIGQEMERLGVDDWRLETGMPQRQSDGLPYASAAEPDDPAVALLWTMDGEDYAIGCDQYTRVRDNMRAIGLYLSEKRKMENRPVTTGQSEFATARLPPADEEAIAAPPVPSEEELDEEPHEILDVSPTAPEEVIEASFRTQVNELGGHPDKGGSTEGFQKLQRAREAMLNE